MTPESVARSLANAPQLAPEMVAQLAQLDDECDRAFRTDYAYLLDIATAGGKRHAARAAA